MAFVNVQFLEVVFPLSTAQRLGMTAISPYPVI